MSKATQHQTDLPVSLSREIKLNDSYLSAGTELKIPDDGSCLFWSAAIGVLAPVLDDDARFRSLFNSLFVTDNKDADLFCEYSDGFKNRIQYFLQTNDTDVILKQGDNDPLYNLINLYFRQKVANYIDEHLSEFKGFIGDNSDYVARLREPTFWGGHIEIIAIYRLLAENYRFVIKNAAIVLGTPDKTTVNIIHTNASGVSSDEKNHYNLLMPALPALSRKKEKKMDQSVDPAVSLDFIFHQDDKKRMNLKTRK